MTTVSFHRTDNVEATKKWNSIIEKIAACGLGSMTVRVLLQEIEGLQCYLDNAEYLEEADPHAVYPTSIYRTCEGYVLAKPDASVIESTMSLSLTTTIKIVSGVLNPANHELRNIYQALGRYTILRDPYYISF